MPVDGVRVVWLEDLRPGDRWETGAHALDHDQVIAFARDFDPQPFHLDPAAAERSVFGGLVASGWHVMGVTMRLLVEQGPPIGNGLVGLGVEEVRWRAVGPRDVLSVVAEVLEVRPSRTRTDRGVVRLEVRTLNQVGDEVQRFVSSLLVLRRPSPVDA